MSHYDRDRGYNNYNNRNYRNNRINETDVPESKHTIFIRGLSGDIQTEEVKDYIEDRVGPVSFDFVKVSQDRTKLFVAVRFESRDNAKEFMKTYEDRDFMGCRCQLSWFRDIRRYMAYQQAKSQRRESPRRRRRSDSENSVRSSPPARSRSRSKRRSKSKTRSRSASRSRSVSRSQSNSPRKISTSPIRRARNEEEPNLSKRKKSCASSVSDNEYVSDDNANKKRKERRNRNDDFINGASPISDRSKSRSRDRSRQRKSVSPVRHQKSKNNNKKQEESSILPSIPLPPQPDSPSVFIPPPSLISEDAPISQKPIAANKEIKINLKVDESPVLGAAAFSVQNTKFSVGLEEEEPPKVIYKSEETPLPPAPPQYKKEGDQLPPPPIPPPITIKSETATAGFTQVSTGTTPNGISQSSKSLTLNSCRNTDKLFGHLKEFQSKLLATVKYVGSNEDSSLSTLKLSSLCAEEDFEEEKNLLRELKISKLSDEQQIRFSMKKKQFEAAYRNDCETYTIVSRALLSKDESLENALKVSLLENMDDLYKKLLQRVDEFLETIV